MDISSLSYTIDIDVCTYWVMGSRGIWFTVYTHRLLNRLNILLYDVGIRIGLHRAFRVKTTFPLQIYLF